MKTEQIIEHEIMGPPQVDQVENSEFVREYSRIWAKWTDSKILEWDELGENGKNYLLKVPFKVQNESGEFEIQSKVLGGFQFLYEFARETLEKEGVTVFGELESSMISRFVVSPETTKNRLLRPIIGLSVISCLSEQEFRGHPLDSIFLNANKMQSASWKRECKPLQLERIGPDNDPFGDGVVKRPMLMKNIQAGGEFARNRITELLNAQ